MPGILVTDMKGVSKWVKILLVASLALNLAFISTMAYNKLTGDKSNRKRKWNPQKREQAFKERLNLSDQQFTDIKEILKDFRMKSMEYKQEILDARIAIIEAMGETDFNPQEVEIKTSQLNQLENKVNLLFVESMMQTNALLEPEQRLKFLYNLSRKWFFIRRCPDHHEPHSKDRIGRKK